MKITMSGEAGAGKGTLKGGLKQKLGYETWSMGDMRREVDKKHGLTIHELNEIGKKEEWTDKETDEFQKKLGKKDNIIVNGRLSWYFIPDSFKIYLETNDREAAKRKFEQKKGSEGKNRKHRKNNEKN